MTLGPTPLLSILPSSCRRLHACIGVGLLCRLMPWQNSFGTLVLMLRGKLMCLIIVFVCVIPTVALPDNVDFMYLSMVLVLQLLATLSIPVIVLLLCLLMKLAVLNLCVTCRWLVRWSTETTWAVFTSPVDSILYRLIVLLLNMIVALFGPTLVEVVVRQLADTMLERASSDVSTLLEKSPVLFGMIISALLVLGMCRHLVR